MLSSKLINLINKNSQPIAVFNPQNLHKKIIYWNGFLPNIKPFYAIKSFNNSKIIKEINKYNTGFDIASKGELYRLKELGISLNNTILANPNASIEDINVSIKNNVSYIVCDDYDTVEYIKNKYSNTKIIWRIKSHEISSLIKFNNKFGASIENTIKCISKNNNGIYGLSFHVGSNCQDINSYYHTLDIIKKEILPNWKGECKMIDIGGGMTNIEDIRKLGLIIEEFINNEKMKNIKWIAEPGRYFSADTISLYTKIIKIKYCNKTNIYNIVINDSVYNSFSGKLFDKQNHIPKSINLGNELVKCNIWGNTCDGLDLITENIFLYKPNINDILVWDNMGSYSFVSASNDFNGFKKAKIVDYNSVF
jgi:ornithine decarboxylase